MRIKRLECAGNQIILHVTERTPLDMKNILKAVKEDKGRVKLLPDGRIVIRNDDRPEDIVTTTKNYVEAPCGGVI